MDLRKKVKIEIELTHKDLCNFENDFMCIPLCDEHKNLKEPDALISYYYCKDCEAVRKKWHRATGKIFWQCGNKFWEKVEE